MIILINVLQQECESSADVPHIESSSGVTEQNGHPLDIEANDTSSCTPDIKQKSKKHKKHKSHHDGQTVSSSSNVVQPDISAASCDSLTTSETKKKKKKKHQEDVVITEVCESDDKNAVVAEESVRKDKKSAKKRKHDNDVQCTHDSGDVQNTSDDFCKRTKTADGKYFRLRLLFLFLF